tara:strand:- start:5 stop:346 length:342 start_codon:yes stop_codon:yes gene_type:complete
MFTIFDDSRFSAPDSAFRLHDAFVLEASRETPDEVKMGIIGLFTQPDDMDSDEMMFDVMVINAIVYGATKCAETPEQIAQNYSMPKHYFSAFQSIGAPDTPTSEDLNTLFNME